MKGGIHKGISKSAFYNGIYLAFFFLFIFCIELFLRVSGSLPNFIYSGVAEVDSLKVFPVYLADSFGVQKLSESSRQIIQGYVSGRREFSVENMKHDQVQDHIADFVGDFYALSHSLSVDSIEKIKRQNGLKLDRSELDQYALGYQQSEFGNRIRNIRNTGLKTSLDTMLMSYVLNPINSDGFRSVSFRSAPEGYKKVLLLGDSYTWGKGAVPIYNSFSDILLARDYLVFNTGIVSTDPAQYAAFSNEYLDVIKPDLVVINFSVNDKMAFYREPKMGETEYHYTNAGFISAWPLGYYMNAADAYAYALEASKIPDNTLFNKICSFSTISTRFWVFLAEKGWVSSYNPKLDRFFSKAVGNADFPVSHTYLNRIKEMCRQRSIPLVISVIPDYFHYVDRYPELKAEELFGAGEYVECKSLTVQDYLGDGDDHFNNSGNEKYADFLQHVIDSIFNVYKP